MFYSDKSQKTVNFKKSIQVTSNSIPVNRTEHLNLKLKDFKNYEKVLRKIDITSLSIYVGGRLSLHV